LASEEQPVLQQAEGFFNPYHRKQMELGEAFEFVVEHLRLK